MSGLLAGATPPADLSRNRWLMGGLLDIVDDLPGRKGRTPVADALGGGETAFRRPQVVRPRRRPGRILTVAASWT